KAQSFDFLGFTHSWQKSRKGKDVVRRTTAKSRFARSLAAVKEWCRTNRHRPAREQRAWLSAVLNGHYAYYGITGNIRRLQEYRNQVVRIWHKWLERRTRGRLLTWDSFNAFLGRHPLPVARITHRHPSWNESLAGGTGGGNPARPGLGGARGQPPRLPGKPSPGQTCASCRPRPPNSKAA